METTGDWGLFLGLGITAKDRLSLSLSPSDSGTLGADCRWDHQRPENGTMNGFWVISSNRDPLKSRLNRGVF